MNQSLEFGLPGYEIINTENKENNVIALQFEPTQTPFDPSIPIT